jgi:filamentous hemagglutinin
VTGGMGQFAQGATVAYLQELGTNGVKQIADSLGSDEARAALHAIVGCAGAAASSQSCGAGAMGASASSVIGSLLGPTTNMSAADREARENLVNSLVAGIASAGGVNAATATGAGQIEVENNQVSLPGVKPKDPLDAIKVGLVNKYCGTGNSCTDEQLKEVLAAQAELSQAVNQYALGTVAAGGVAAALAASVVAGPEALAAYKAAQAAYSLYTAGLTGAGVSGGVYTVSAAGAAFVDYYRNTSTFSESFDQRFSGVGLATASTVGALNSMFGTAMYGWAGVANSWKNVATVPGAVIRLNGIALGQTAGKAAQAAANQSK